MEARQDVFPEGGGDDNPGLVQHQIVLVSEVIPDIPEWQNVVGASRLGLGETFGLFEIKFVYTKPL